MPLSRDALARGDMMGKSRKKRCGQEGSGASPRFLVVDNSAFARKQVMDELAKGGCFDVIEAESHSQALKALKDKAPDFVILDVIMKGKQGMSTLEEIKKRSPSTKVIMVTVLDQKDFIAQAKKLGADDYISKPFKPGAVLKVVNRLYD
ncbi:response regulator [Candidatus Woesearchaeota archaeon]|nr:response regulator [Candidatus Woesearchaeota archaeon]